MTSLETQQGDTPPFTPDAAPAPVWEPLPEGAQSAEEAASTQHATTPIDQALERKPAGPSAPAVASAPAHARRPRSVAALLSIAGLVFLVGLAFTVGRMTAPGGTGTGLGNAGAGPFPGGQNGALPNDPGGFDRGGALGPSVTGTVASVGTDTLTIRLASGQTVTVATGSSTTYHTQTAASRSSVAIGATVSVRVDPGGQPGTASGTRVASDVTITAQ